MILYYIRHGQPNYELNCLTELGKKQALFVSRRKDFEDIEVVFSSPSGRAMQTAMPTANTLGKAINTLDWCDEEIAWQRFTNDTPEGKRWYYQNDVGMCELAKAQSAGKEWWKSEFFGKQTGENIALYEKRVDEFLSSLGFRHDRQSNCYECTGAKYKKVALFAHEGAGYAILSAITDIAYPCLARFYNYHTGVTTIEFDESKQNIVPVVAHFSDTRHLPEDLISR